MDSTAWHGAAPNRYDDEGPQNLPAYHGTHAAGLPTIPLELLLISLDDRRRTHLGLVWILAELAPCIPLAEQIPALIELDPNLIEPHLIVVRQLRVPVKALLLVHKTFDFPQD
jgi:hypothetical protein